MIIVTSNNENLKGLRSLRVSKAPKASNCYLGYMRSDPGDCITNNVLSRAKFISSWTVILCSTRPASFSVFVVVNRSWLGCLVFVVCSRSIYTRARLSRTAMVFICKWLRRASPDQSRFVIGFVELAHAQIQGPSTQSLTSYNYPVSKVAPPHHTCTVCILRPSRRSRNTIKTPSTRPHTSLFTPHPPPQHLADHAGKRHTSASLRT